jgi:hypothetical protein
MHRSGIRGWSRAALVLLLGCSGCAYPIDTLGVEEIVREHDQVAVQDDAISSKHPEYDQTLTVEEEFSSCIFTLNKSASVTRLDIQPLAATDGELNGRVFRNRTEALGALGSRPVMPSMEVVNGALKPFNDGLYAAVELGAEEGSNGSLVAKRTVLRDLLAELVRRAGQGSANEQPYARAAAAQIAAATLLSGETPAVSADLMAEATNLVARFDTDLLASRPIGFYSWTPGLASVFRRDRWLQSPSVIAPEPAVFAATALALAGSADLSARYSSVLDLQAGLTNPAAGYSPRDIVAFMAGTDPAAIAQAFIATHPDLGDATNGSCVRALAFWPASDSPELRLFRRLSCDLGQPLSGGNLLDLLVSAIQNGGLDLTPTAESGWYDRQLYALETLLVPDRAPESNHLLLTQAYKEKLVETFKSILIQTRETHVKQLMGGSTAGSAELPVDVYPKLPVEPFPTFYLRTARAYRFVETLLRTVLGHGFVDQAARLLEDGSLAPKSLGAELRERTELLYGLHVVSAASLGMRNAITDEEAQLFVPETSAEYARAWLKSWSSDLDVGRDPRVAVPVWTDYGANRTTYWAVVGVKVLRVHASFYPGYEPQVLSTDWCTKGAFVAYEPYLLVEATLEFQRSASAPPLTRDELRTLLDRYQSLPDMKAALEAS